MKKADLQHELMKEEGENKSQTSEERRVASMMNQKVLGFLDPKDDVNQVQMPGMEGDPNAG